jgi:hypothetical protein
LPVGLGLIGGRGSDVHLAELIADFEKMSSVEKDGRRSGLMGDHDQQKVMDGSMEL